MKFKVKALKLGYVDHIRIKEGQVFMIDEKNCIEKKAVKDESKIEKLKDKIVKGPGGELYLPTWVELVDDTSKASNKKNSHVEKSLDANMDVI